MRVTSKDSGDKLAKQLASNICECNKERHVVIAANDADTKEEAKQSAIMYWMMGWTWDEIETVLEDSEYSDSIISSAVKAAKEYAKKILNEGPFAIFEDGQGVKLANGSLGTLVAKKANYIEVNLKDHGLVKVSENQIDLVATKQLTEAFNLRKQAAKSISDQQDHIFSFTASDKTYMASTSDSVQFIEDILFSIQAIQRQAADVLLDSDKVSYRWKNADWNKRAKEKEFAQYIVASSSEESRVFNDVATYLQDHLRGQLEATYNKIVEDPSLSTSTMLDPVKEHLQNNIGPMLTKVSSYLDNVQQRNDKVRSLVPDATFPISWAVNAWDNTKEFSNQWDTEIKQLVNEAVGMLTTFLNKTAADQNNATILAALENLV